MSAGDVKLGQISFQFPPIHRPHQSCPHKKSRILPKLRIRHCHGGVNNKRRLIKPFFLITFRVVAIP